LTDSALVVDGTHDPHGFNPRVDMLKAQFRQATRARVNVIPELQPYTNSVYRNRVK